MPLVGLLSIEGLICLLLGLFRAVNNFQNLYLILDELEFETSHIELNNDFSRSVEKTEPVSMVKPTKCTYCGFEIEQENPRFCPECRTKMIY
jgi:predicted Zn-ribbon and HTH transcriptional regulator